MRTVIFGGGGFIGRHLAMTLSARGHRVVLMTRHREKIKRDLILLPQTDVIACHPRQPRTWLPFVRGADAVVNLAGILNENKKGDFEQIHCELTRMLVDSCLSNKVGLFVYFSALGAAMGAPSNYLRSKARAEQIVRDASGLRHAIICPSVVCGEGDSFLNRFVALARVLPVLVLPCAEAKMQPLAVGDLARLTVRALEGGGRENQKLSAAGPRAMTLRQIVELTLSAAGTPRPIIPLAEKTSYLLAAAMEPFCNIITRDNCKSATIPSVCRADDNAAMRLPGVLTPLEAVLQVMFDRRAGAAYRAR